MRRAAVALIIGLTMVLAAGCATAGGAASSGSPTPSPTPSGSTLPTGFVSTYGNWPDGIDDTTSLDPDKAELIGPHSVLRLDTVARTRTLTADQVRGGLGDLTAPLHARPGHEIVLAHLAPPSDTEPGLPGADERDAGKTSVVVDGRARTLAGSLFGAITIIVQAPTGAPVTLRTNDAGRPQELDLRTGERTRAASPLYYPVREASPAFDDAYYVLGTGRTAALMAASGRVVLAPYADGLGWARKGRAWLVVSVGFSTSGDTQFRAKARRSLTLSAAGATSTGRVLGSGDTSTDPDPGTTAGGQLRLAFDVPATLRSGTLDYLPVGSFVVDGTTVSATPYHGGDPSHDTTVQHRHFTLKPRP